MTVVITRPKHQAENLATLIKNLGFECILFPAIEITFLQNTPPLKEMMFKLGSFDYVIFLSANAVHPIATLWPKNKSPRVIALGPGTTSALEKNSIEIHAQPEQFSSEGVLGIAELEKLNGKAVLICCGHSSAGASLLRREFKKRGASIVEELVCYRSDVPCYSESEVKQLCQLPVQCMISTSLQGLKNLYEIFSVNETCLAWLQKTPLIVISLKMKEYAASHDFRIVTLASNASDSAVMAEIEKLEPIDKYE
jgi:uroporphyrinogen-III synthase